MKLINNLGRIVVGTMCAGAIMLAANSCQFDDTHLKDSLEDLNERVDALEDFCDQIQSEIETLQDIIQKLQEKVTVNNVVDNGDGYTINFSDGTSVTITDGEDGKDGQDGQDGEDGMTPPTIIVMEENGVYYWGYEYADGSRDFIEDENGDKIPVTGEAPQVRINPETGNWEISTDGGITWEDTGMPSTGAGTGESIFAGVDEDENYVYLTLRDGTVITLPKTSELAFDFGTNGETLYFERGESKTLTYTLSGATDVTITKPDGWRAAIEETGFVITAPAAENTFAETEGLVTVIVISANGQTLIAEQPVIIGTAPVTDYFTIEVPEAEITASSARILATCNDPAIYWTSQIMTQDEFDMYVGDKANMEQYFMDLLESTANYYGYSSVVELLPDFLYPGDYVDDYTYSGLYSETKYLTYSVGMDLEANFTTDFYWGPEFTTLEMQVIDLTFEIVATPTTTEVSLDIYPSDKAAYYFATVIDDWWSYGYTDEDIMNDICSQYSFLLPYYAQTGDVTGYVVGGMNPGMDYYAIAFGVDVNALTFNSALTVEPFSTLEGEETDAYAEANCTNYWSIADLEAYNPSYGAFLSDPDNPNLAAVDYTYNETATSAVFVMWIGDVSETAYDELYSATMSQGDIVYKGDPAPLYYVALDGSYSTLCTIGRDAAGNFGDMHISVVQFTEEGKSTDFALFDEYYNDLMGTASVNSVSAKSNFLSPIDIESIRVMEVSLAPEKKNDIRKITSAVSER